MKNINYILGSIAFLLGLTSCSDEKDMGGVLEEKFMIAAIDVASTPYDLDQETICLLKNAELQMSWTIQPENVTNSKVKWSSDDESIASVTQDGLIKAHKAGRTIVRLTPEVGFGAAAATFFCIINVVEQFEYVEMVRIINPPTEAIPVSGKYELNISSLPETATFKRFKWTSSNPDIVSVDEKGIITAVSVGKALITVVADDLNPGTPASASVEINTQAAIPIEDIQIVEEEALNRLGYGQTIQLTYNLIPENATASLIEWSSSNEDAILVDKNGKLTVNNMLGGTAIITASYKDVKRSVSATVAEGHLCFSFKDGLPAPWRLENNAEVGNVDGKKTVVNMGAGSKYRGDLALIKNGEGQNLVITPENYRYIAIKIGLLSELIPGKNSQGCIKLEMFDEAVTIGKVYTGSIGNANNSFSILDAENISTTKPNIVYFDLMSNFDMSNPSGRAKFNLSHFKFVIADYLFPATTYDLYWVRSFKTEGEMRAFVQSEQD